MRVILVMMFLLGAFFAGVFVGEGKPVSAEADLSKRQWQYQCFVASKVTDVTLRANAMGKQGWSMVTSAGTTTGQTLWCFQRPLWKEAD